jgi:hypothetical protein
LHGWLAVHAPQLPLPSQTPPEHAVPAGAAPVCVHTAVPLLQSVVPSRHGLEPGLHAAPDAQLTQVPLSQT